MATEIHTPDDLLKLIEKTREEQRFSMKALAERAGYAHAGYWWWRSRRGNISFAAALNYCQALGLRVVVEPSRE